LAQAFTAQRRWEQPDSSANPAYMAPPAIFSIAATINLAICFSLGYTTRSKVDGALPGGFVGHLTRYLVAWTLCIAGEWFGGPGVYALYSSYGFERPQIAQLFVLGFAWSSVLGCFAGGFADRFGRKRSAMLFCTFGVITVCCKHFASYPVLMVARFCDGAHASLLYTAFESWLVSEHSVRHGFPGELLGHSFALMFSVSYLVAVACGFVAQLGVDLWPVGESIGLFHYGGWCIPFDLSMLCQIIGGIYIALNWDENYGEQNDGSSAGSPWTAGSLRSALLKKEVLLCGAIVTCFESSMFIFVFSWTPALSPNGDHSLLPCGLIFATYMMACMSGASIYRLCSSFRNVHIVLGVTALAAIALSVPAVIGISDATVYLNFAAFVVFELCVGAYFPAAATIKGEFVEDKYRVTIYNLFRTPMNAIVVAVLLFGPSLESTFRLLFALLATVTVLIAAFCYSEGRVDDSKALPLLAASA